VYLVGERNNLATVHFEKVSNAVYLLQNFKAFSLEFRMLQPSGKREDELEILKL